MGKVNFNKIRGAAFLVRQDTVHSNANPYTFEVTISPRRVLRGACTETRQTQVEIYDVGDERCFDLYSHMIVVQSDTFVGSSQISRTASRIGSECNLHLQFLNWGESRRVVLQSRDSSHGFCQPLPNCPVAVYSPWKATATGPSLLTQAPSFKPASNPKATSNRNSAQSPKPAPAAKRLRMDLSNNLFKQPLSLATASVSEHQGSISRNIVSSTALSATSKVQTTQNAPQGIICRNTDTQHGPEPTTLFGDDSLVLETTVGSPYDVHFYHADQTSTRSRGIAAHRDVLSVFPKLQSLIAIADIGKNILREKQGWNRLGSNQAGKQTPAVVNISHFSFDAFRALVVYVYTGDFDLALSYVSESYCSPQQSPPRWVRLHHIGPGDRVLDLYELRELLLICGMFDVDGLRFHCVGMALSLLSAENAIFMLVCLGREVKEIKRTVMAVIKDNFQVIAGKYKRLEDMFEEFEDQDCGDLVEELKEELTRADG
ncbi:hypothetical protein BGZ68_000922 [Mortierella alpina]|nr:hypothetical protein BGZ68_000922 [Mortierella alpina]